VREIFRPYHDRLETERDHRRQSGRPVALIAMHSFTPVFKAHIRLWHAGGLYNRDPCFAHILMALLKREKGLATANPIARPMNRITRSRYAANNAACITLRSKFAEI
jgi:predicted N-formylglutamate amidohydrolase